MSTATIAPMSTRPTTTLRLTRRGRLAIFVLSVAVLLAVGFALASGSMATAERGESVPTEVITVGTGQTLWDIAADVSDDGDVRAAMREIERINALESTMLVAGQRLAIPVG